MPDYPRIGGASAEEVWAYATRSITEKTDFELSATSRGAIVDETWDEAQSGHAGAGTFGKRLDADMTSRSSHAAADIWAVATRALTDKIGFGLDDGEWPDVWAVATRKLTGMDGTPRSDLLGEDASFEAGSGARKARIDDLPAFETLVEGTQTCIIGTEHTIFEKTDDKAGIIEGVIDVTNLASGDTLEIREYMQVLATGGYVLYAKETYTGAQTYPLIQVLGRFSAHDVKATIKQTAGTGRNITYCFTRRREA